MLVSEDQQANLSWLATHFRLSRVLLALPSAVRWLFKMPLGALFALGTTHDRRHLWQAEQVAGTRVSGRSFLLLWANRRLLHNGSCDFGERGLGPLRNPRKSEWRRQRPCGSRPR